MYNVFTYGTLMADGTFMTMTNAKISEMPAFEPTVAIIKGFKRHGVTGAHFPAVVEDTASDGVIGVLWQNVTEEQVQQLDSYEGVPTLYKRKSAKAQLYNGDSVDCEVYVWARGEEGLDPGDWPRGDTLAMMHRGYDKCKELLGSTL